MQSEMIFVPFVFQTNGTMKMTKDFPIFYSRDEAWQELNTNSRSKRIPLEYREMTMNEYISLVTPDSLCRDSEPADPPASAQSPSERPDEP